MTAVLYLIPPNDLIAPICAALAFIQLCLNELERLRSAESGALAQGRGVRNEGLGVRE